MPYGHLTDEMKDILRPLVKDKYVWDLGAGDLTYSKLLRDMGGYVMSIDCREMVQTMRLAMYHGTFQQALQDGLTKDRPVEVAFVSWPPNHRMLHMTVFVKMAETVIYLGLNCPQRGTACGGPHFWLEVSNRPLLHIVEDERNDFLVYGKGTRTQPFVREELEARSIWLPLLEGD